MPNEQNFRRVRGAEDFADVHRDFSVGGSIGVWIPGESEGGVVELYGDRINNFSRKFKKVTFGLGRLFNFFFAFLPDTIGKKMTYRILFVKILYLLHTLSNNSQVVLSDHPSCQHLSVRNLPRHLATSQSNG